MSRSLLLFACLLALSPLTDAQDEPANIVFRSDVALVRVDAQVLDHGNQAVTGLRAEDFVIRQDGRILPITSFASENMPVDILLLLDVSGSMRVHVERIAEAAHQALRVLGNDDRLAIMVFDTNARLRMPFRNSHDDVNREFERLLRQETFSGGTDITYALLRAADYVHDQARRDARRAIVILTDDQTQRRRDEYAVGRALQRADAVLSLLLAPDAMASGPYGTHGGGGYPNGGGGGGGYPRSGSTWPGGGYPGGGGGPLGGVILGRRGGYGGRSPGGIAFPGDTHSAGTPEIARDSGGDTMSVDDAYALERTLQRLRQRYALYFHSPEGSSPGSERAVEVDLSDSARRRYRYAEVRYRRIYLAPGGTTDSGSIMVTKAPSTLPSPDRSRTTSIPDPDRPSMSRRRVAVDEPQGPRVNMPTATQQETSASSSATAPADPPPVNSEPAPQPKRGWRRVTDPPPPSTSDKPSRP